MQSFRNERNPNVSYIYIRVLSFVGYFRQSHNIITIFYVYKKTQQYENKDCYIFLTMYDSV